MNTGWLDKIVCPFCEAPWTDPSGGELILDACDGDPIDETGASLPVLECQHCRNQFTTERRLVPTWRTRAFTPTPADRWYLMSLDEIDTDTGLPLWWCIGDEEGDSPGWGSFSPHDCDCRVLFSTEEKRRFIEAGLHKNIQWRIAD